MPLPDFTATLVRSAVDRETAWAEWDWSGSRPDGKRQMMRGVTIFGVRDGVVRWARFYMEPVEEDGAGIEEAVRRVTTEQPA